MQVHTEMEMVARGKPRLSGFADRLALFDGVADLDVHRAQVRVERE